MYVGDVVDAGADADGGGGGVGAGLRSRWDGGGGDQVGMDRCVGRREDERAAGRLSVGAPAIITGEATLNGRGRGWRCFLLAGAGLDALCLAHLLLLV